MLYFIISIVCVLIGFFIGFGFRLYVIRTYQIGYRQLREDVEKLKEYTEHAQKTALEALEDLEKTQKDCQEAYETIKYYKRISASRWN